MYEKRVKGGPKRKHTLGTYCTWSDTGQRLPIQLALSEARQRALEIELEAGLGVDRVEDARAAKIDRERAAALLVTVEALIDIYAELKLQNLKTGDERSRELKKALRNYLNRNPQELSKADLQAIIDERALAGRLVYANRIRSYLRAFTAWAARRDYLEEDIGFALEGTGPEVARDRVLSLDEVREIYKATSALNELWGPMLRLLVLTGQRRGEISTLRWAHVDLAARRIALPGSLTKNGRPHITHLSQPAHDELSVLWEQGTKGEFVFTTTGVTPSSGISKAKRHLDRELGNRVGKWRLHDLRRSMATALAEAGVPEGVVDRIQNHSASGSAPSAVARVYQQSDLLPQRAAALDRWADMVTDRPAELLSIGDYFG